MNQLPVRLELGRWVFSPVRGELVEPWTLINDRAHAARQSLPFASPKASNQVKGDPDIRPDPRFGVKTSRGPKLATLKQRTASSTFSLQISGANTRGPFEQIFDRFAMRTTGTRTRASGLRLLLGRKRTTAFVHFFQKLISHRKIGLRIHRVVEQRAESNVNTAITQSLRVSCALNDDGAHALFHLR